MNNFIDFLNCNEGAASVLLSVVSLVVAVGIPAWIAHKQNKIALYEKRLECYQKLMALKRFSCFADRFGSFEKNEDFDPVSQCQTEYLEVHGVLDDEKKARNRLYSNMSCMYALQCLAQDEELFLSIPLLTKSKKQDQLDSIETSLQDFVKKLFSKSTRSDELKQSQKQLAKAFTAAADYCDAMYRDMKLYRNHSGKKDKSAKDADRGVKNAGN